MTDRGLEVTNLGQLASKTVDNKDNIIAARCSAIQNLNQMLATPALSTSDEAIAAVLKLVISDLCHGETQDLRVHADGVRQMTNLRGGLANLGMNGTLAKMVVM